MDPTVSKALLQNLLVGPNHLPSGVSPRLEAAAYSAASLPIDIPNGTFHNRRVHAQSADASPPALSLEPPSLNPSLRGRSISLPTAYSYYKPETGKEFFANLPPANLSNLDLSGHFITTKQLQQLVHWFSKPLQSLKLNVTNLHEADWDLLTQLSNLTHLKLKSSCLPVGLIEKLGELKKLEFLELSGSRSINRKWMQAVGKLTHLKALTLKKVNLEEEGILEELSPLVNLEVLNLSLSSRNSQPLYTLNAIDTSTLSAFSQLQELFLKGCHLNEELGLEHLSQLNQLQRLSLFKCKGITGHNAHHLAQLQNLTHLTLFGAHQLTDQAFLAISALPLLQSLVATDCYQVSDVGFEAFMQLPNLHSLTLFGCNNLSQPVLNALKERVYQAILIPTSAGSSYR